MIEDILLKNRLLNLIRKTVCELPKETFKALQETYDKEDEGSVAKAHLETNLKNLALSTKYQIPMCADTGFPVFFIRIGKMKGLNLGQIQRCAIQAVEEATANGYIRPNAVEPISRKNPGTNTGPGSPVFELKIDSSIDYCQISYVPKGGGTEIFGPAFRTILPADGIQGLKKFIFDTIVVNGNKTGANCPPNIIGVGVGGTSESCMAMAKQAACLRKIGSRNPDPEIKELENELLEIINESGIGPLGMGGKITIFDLHIEFSLTHLVGTPIAIAAQCPAARVGTINLKDNGVIEEIEWPEWFKY